MDPRRPDPRGSPSAGITAAFGEFAIAAGLIEEARRAGDWLLRLVEQNERHLSGGEFHLALAPNGALDIETVVGTSGRDEPTWILGIARPGTYDRLYRCARRTYRHTFLGTRLADGSWGHELHDDQEAAVDQQTLEGISAVSAQEAWQRHRGHKVPFSSSIEITSENLVMILHLRAGIQALERELSMV